MPFSFPFPLCSQFSHFYTIKYLLFRFFQPLLGVLSNYYGFLYILTVCHVYAIYSTLLYIYLSKVSHFVCLMGGVPTRGNYPKAVIPLQSVKGVIRPPKMVTCRIRDPGHQVMKPRPWDIPWSEWSNWDQPSSPPRITLGKTMEGPWNCPVI